MPRSHVVDVLIVGGGATGAGIARDLARRGVGALLVERGDFATGTTGRYHGLLHSGGRYVSKDPLAANECITENRILRRIAPACIEDTGGYFVATPHDPEGYVTAFPDACRASDVDCEEVDVRWLLAREPALNPETRRAFRVPDGSLEPWQLVEATLEDARAHGAEAISYHRLVGFDLDGGRIVKARLADERSGTIVEIAPRFVVAAAGAWAGEVAALAGVELTMTPGKGTMLIYDSRMTDAVINRCHKSADGDIMVPVHTVAILGTTDIKVPDPDEYEITRAEVVRLVDEGAKLFPDLPRMRILRAYAGVRPLYQAPTEASSGGNRSITRAHAILDHADQGVANYVSIVGGKLTTHRLMAEQTVDVVAEKLGIHERCTTAEEVLPGMEPGKTHWLGHRLAEHEEAGGGDKDLICECEFVTRPTLAAYLDSHPACTLDDVRRATRVGMGPCQGGFCTFRAAGMLAERGSDPGARDGAAVAVEAAAAADRAMTFFLRERFKGTRPIAAGRQLQEYLMTTGIYVGTLGSGSLPEPIPGRRFGERIGPGEHAGQGERTGPAGRPEGVRDGAR
jgi:glycerol-3-phosphate dehydrogenase